MPPATPHAQDESAAQAARFQVQFLAGLADLRREQGRYDEAEPLFRRALAVAQQAFGPRALEVAAVLNNFAALRAARGDHAGAERLYRRALASKEKLLGPEHPDVAMTLSKLAVVYKSQRRYGDAEVLYGRALSIFGRALEPAHPKLATCRLSYAGLLREMGCEAEPQTLERRADTP